MLPAVLIDFYDLDGACLTKDWKAIRAEEQSPNIISYLALFDPKRLLFSSKIFSQSGISITVLKWMPKMGE